MQRPRTFATTGDDRGRSLACARRIERPPFEDDADAGVVVQHGDARDAEAAELTHRGRVDRGGCALPSINTTIVANSPPSRSRTSARG